MITAVLWAGLVLNILGLAFLPTITNERTERPGNGILGFMMIFHLALAAATVWVAVTADTLPLTVVAAGVAGMTVGSMFHTAYRLTLPEWPQMTRVRVLRTLALGMIQLGGLGYILIST